MTAGQQDAIIITFDEDNNNLSLGIGNQGNHVPMIVIPNTGAVTDVGMQSGQFVTNSYYNQYSLMSTIEDALVGILARRLRWPRSPTTTSMPRP